MRKSQHQAGTHGSHIWTDMRHSAQTSAPLLPLLPKLVALLHFCAQAWARECDERRLFLWSPICAACGVLVYIMAACEPPLWFVLGVLFSTALLAFAVRQHQRALLCALALCSVALGLASMALRSARVAAPILPRTTIGMAQGYIEEIDVRPRGARLLVRLDKLDSVAADSTPYRIRVSTNYAPEVAAGDYVSFKARLMPPSHASLPQGYDFARDAWFVRLGAVGNVLGHSIVRAPAPHEADVMLRFYAALDRGRNQLAKRVERVIGGPAGAIGAAMVTGKRDFLDEPTREIIRQAGIFHIITIAGVQMTLVAGIFFFGFRRILACSRTLALHYPIKKWAAVLAMVGSIFYDIATGSRVGTERALIMTLIMLGAVIFERNVMSMRNLALAMWVIILCEPEAILGVSFQLSFAAVAGLIAVYEFMHNKQYRTHGQDEMGVQRNAETRDVWARFYYYVTQGPMLVLLSTLCASLATMSFMAFHFHEISPYVLIGNPLTLTMIEFFAVPGALLGTFLYPFGLDAFVWHYVGFGIKLVLWIAQAISAWPHATVYVHAFAPWSLAFLTLAVLNCVLWRGWLKLLSVPPLLIGLYGAFYIGAPFDLIVPPNVDAIALRAADGALLVAGKSPNRFAVEQWLRADGDGRSEVQAVAFSERAYERRLARGEIEPAVSNDAARARAQHYDVRCDKNMCHALFMDGRSVYIVYEAQSFASLCQEADILITPLFAPRECGAPIIIDRRVLRDQGAVMLRAQFDADVIVGDRHMDDDRPWWPLPQRDWRDERAASGPELQDDVFDPEDEEGRLN